MDDRRSYRVAADIFAPLSQGFEAGRPDPDDDPAPVDPVIVQRIGEALTSAVATKPPGLPA